MNMNQLINMVTNQVVRRVVNIVVDRGFRFAARKAPPPAPDATPQNSHVTTPAELAKEAQLRALADQAAKSAKMIRRIGR